MGSRLLIEDATFLQAPVVTAIAVSSLHVLWAQDLAPRAYVITPLHSNAITLTWSFYDGSIDYNGALPVSPNVSQRGRVATKSISIGRWRQVKFRKSLC
jgi:hypothetical protein